jgi:riboflavin kinase
MEVETLKRLALLGAMEEHVCLSSSKFASSIGSSAQTAARRLSALEDEGFLTRIVTSEGQKVKITEKGAILLKAEYIDYQKIFGGIYINKIKGKVVSGLGEGQYYISLQGYRTQFLEKLGFDPCPGTLNLKLSEPFVSSNSSSVVIDGFKDESRTYGGGRCYPVKILGLDCAIIRPERSNYPSDLVEVIAPVHFRKTFGLLDGDLVEVVLE